MGQEENIRTMEGFCDKVKAAAGKTFNVERGGISHVAFVTKHCAKHYLAKKNLALSRRGTLGEGVQFLRRDLK